MTQNCAEIKVDQEKWKSFVLVKELKHMQFEQKCTQAEKDLFYRTTIRVITMPGARRLGGLDGPNSSIVELNFSRLARKVKRKFPISCRQELSKLKRFD